MFPARFATASDHADPLDIPAPWDLFDDGQLSPKKVQELGGGLTDLFIFPVKENGEVAFVPPRDEYFRTDIPAEEFLSSKNPAVESYVRAVRRGARRAPEVQK